ncbi:hypothetical protein [uncultured Rikenella sp.]|nr:hypothetical protein [uncultured Rikenella sp.]
MVKKQKCYIVIDENDEVKGVLSTFEKAKMCAGTYGLNEHYIKIGYFLG